MQSFSDHELDVIMDFEFHPNKRPKLLAQTAAHVAGAAFLYQYRNLSAEYCSRPKVRWISDKILCRFSLGKFWAVCCSVSPIDGGRAYDSLFSPLFQKMMGLCLHPTYGGWFAIRGCLIFKNISSPDLVQKEPLDILSLPADQINALELFNFHWRDSRFRDVVPVKEKYSTDQQLYFNTPPGLRKKILENLRAKYSWPTGSHLEMQNSCLIFLLFWGLFLLI